MPRDPTTESVLHDFPRLRYDMATGSMVELQVAEAKLREAFVTRFPVYVRVWEYGYYFLDRFLKTQKPIKAAYVAPASLFSEGHDSLRTSFVMLTLGYPVDAVAKMRRVHESFVKACDLAWSPNKTVSIVRESSPRPSEHRLGLSFKGMLNVGGAFVHGNTLQTFGALRALRENRAPDVRYGPRHDDELARYATAVSVFWLYLSIKVAPSVFPDFADSDWIAQQPDSARFLRGYLQDRQSAELVDACDSVDVMLDRHAAGEIPLRPARRKKRKTVPEP